jgi:hypothetical protein
MMEDSMPAGVPDTSADETQATDPSGFIRLSAHDVATLESREREVVHD